MTEDQKVCLRAYGRKAAMELARMLVDRADEYVELAVERSSTLGVLEYGDASYHKSNLELLEDVGQELSDAIYYLHIVLARVIAEKIPALDMDDEAATA